MYIEAVAPGTSASAKAIAQRRAVFYDVIDKVADTRFYLWLDKLVDGPQPPSAAKLRDELNRWLAELDPESDLPLDRAPTHEWSKDGWSVRFRAIPAGQHGARPGDGRRAIGVYGNIEASFVDDAPSLRKALTRKHHRYGQLDAPFVVALGTHNLDRDRWHATNALYGQEAYQLTETAGDLVEARAVRQPDGYFGAAPVWKHRNVSAVLVVNQLMPYYFQRAEVTLWRHPHPLQELPKTLGIPATTVSHDGTKLVEQAPLKDAQVFFNLPSAWPPGEALAQCLAS